MRQVRITKEVRLKMLGILIPLLLITFPAPFLMAHATGAWVSPPDRYRWTIEIEHEGSWSGEVFKSGRDDFALVETDGRPGIIPLASEVESEPVKFFAMGLGSQRPHRAQNRLLLAGFLARSLVSPLLTLHSLLEPAEKAPTLISGWGLFLHLFTLRVV